MCGTNIVRGTTVPDSLSTDRSSAMVVATPLPLTVASSRTERTATNPAWRTPRHGTIGCKVLSDETVSQGRRPHVRGVRDRVEGVGMLGRQEGGRGAQQRHRE